MNEWSVKEKKQKTVNKHETNSCTLNQIVFILIL